MKRSGRKVGRPPKNQYIESPIQPQISTINPEEAEKRKEIYLLQISNLNSEINNIKEKEKIINAAKENMILELQLLENRCSYMKKIIEFYSKTANGNIASTSNCVHQKNGTKYSTPLDKNEILTVDKKKLLKDTNEKVATEETNKIIEMKTNCLPLKKTNTNNNIKKIKLLREKVKKYLIETVGKDVIICNLQRITKQESETSQPETDVKLLRINVLGPNNIWVQDLKSPEMPKVASRYMRYYKVKYKCSKYEISNKQPVVVDDDPDFVILTPSGNANKRNLFCIGSIGEITINEIFELVATEPFTISPMTAEVVMERKHIALLEPLILENLSKESEPGSIPHISLLAESTSKMATDDILPITATNNYILPNNEHDLIDAPVMIKNEEFVIENDPNFSRNDEDNDDVIDLTEII